MDGRAFCIQRGFNSFSSLAIQSLHLYEDEATLGFDGSSLCLRNGGSIACDANTETWDPRGLLGSGGTPYDECNIKALARYIEDSVCTIHASGRQAEGIHGEGPFATAFRRLRGDPEFPLTLLGFGPGSTPAGDDFIAGFLSCCDLLAGGPGLSQTSLRAGLKAGLGRTTPSGRSLLMGAIEGVPPAYIVDITLAAANWLKGRDRAPEQLSEAIEQALGHGATSGEDALSGFVFALVRRS